MKYKAGYNPTFINRWVQVTEKAFKFYKNRCNAITCTHKPSMAIPITAIKKIERVNFDLPFKKAEKEKYGNYLSNQFEIYLKGDFLDMFLSPEYEVKLNQKGNELSNNHHHHHRDSHQHSPGKVSTFSHTHSTPHDRNSSPRKMRPSSPGKVRENNGKAHDMNQLEMKQRYRFLEEGIHARNLDDNLAKSVNTQGAWSNREEEWYFNNKRMLFSTKGAEISDQWVEKLNALVTEDHS